MRLFSDRPQSAAQAPALPACRVVLPSGLTLPDTDPRHRRAVEAAGERLERSWKVAVTVDEISLTVVREEM